MKIDNSTEIVSVTLIDIVTREESKLFERPKSKCYFKEPFKFKDYYIQLRLDWSDVQKGEPVLDADIWLESEGKQEKLRNGKWHHNKKELDTNTGQILYNFEFNNLTLLLITKKTIEKTITSNVCFIDKTDKETLN